MSRRFQYALLAAFALPLSLQQSANALSPMHRVAKKPAKEVIADLEQLWRTATLAGDSAAMAPLLSDDYVGVSWSGQLNTKETQLDRLRTRSVLLTRLDLSDLKVKVVDKIAIVTARADVEGTADGRDASGAFLYTRIYQRKPSGAWQITNFEATRLPGTRHTIDRSAAKPAAAPSSQ